MPLPHTPHPLVRKPALITGNPSGGLWRNVAVAALLSIVLGGLLRYGAGSGWFDWFGSAIAALSIFTLLVLVSRHQSRNRIHQESDTAFHDLFNSVNDAIFIHDMQGRFLEVNQAACLRLGYSREELLELSPAEIDTPEFAARIPAIWEKFRQDGQVVLESAHRTRDGQIIPVEISARLARFGGQPVVISVARDLRDRSNMQAALRLSEEKARLLLDVAPESAFLIAADGTVLAVNKVAAQRFGLTPEQMEGRDVYGFMPEKVAKNRRLQMEEVIRHRRPIHFRDERQGREFDIDMYPAIDPDGMVSRLAVYATDVTERVQLQALDSLLSEMDRQVLRGQPLSDLLEFICTEIVRLFRLRFAWVGRKEVGGQVYYQAGAGPATGYAEELRQIGVRWDNSPVGIGPVGVTIRTGQPQLFHRDDAAFSLWRESASRYGLEAVLGLPLVLRGEVYGTLTLYSDRPDAFAAPGTIERLTSLSGRICVVLESALDQEQMRLLGSALSTASNAVFITNEKGVIEWANQAFTHMTGYPLEEVLGRNPRFLKSEMQSEAFYRQLWETISAGVTWSAEAIERHKEGHLFTVRQTVTPIRANDGHIKHFISILEDITPQKEAEARIYHMAHYDALTDLPNRMLFQDRLHQTVSLARRRGHLAALLFLDLDKFKQVNDQHGHHIGDLLLQGVAERLLACVRESDTVARLAGDEFTILLPQIGQEADAIAVAEKAIAELAKAFQLEDVTLHTSTSIGIALAPRDAEDSETLMRLADAAMYRAKQEGRGTWRMHQAEVVQP